MSTGLAELHVNILKTLCRHYPEIESIVLFCSRAKGCAKQGSDIDIAIKGAHVSLDTIMHLCSELEESTLPFFVDVLHYDTIKNHALQEHIGNVGITL